MIRKQNSQEIHSKMMQWGGGGDGEGESHEGEGENLREYKKNDPRLFF